MARAGTRRRIRTRETEGVALSETPHAATHRPVGVRDIPLVLVAPRRLFARAEDVAAYGWPLVVLLTAVTLIGYATVETGLIDREVERRVRGRIAQLEQQQLDVVERSALREMYAKEYKKGEFERLLTRIQVVVAEPVKVLAALLLIAALLYAVVALTGRKPEWHTLMTICVFAGFIETLRLLMRLVLMLRYETLEAETSLAPLIWITTSGESADPVVLSALSGLLSATDPFRIWFWLAVIVGLSVTAQLRGWRAWLTCGLCWLIGAGARCGLAVAAAQGAAGGGAAG